MKNHGGWQTRWVSLAFLIIVVLSNITTQSGRWTLLLFALVVMAMVIGWYAVRDNAMSDKTVKDSPEV